MNLVINELVIEVPLAYELDLLSTNIVVGPVLLTALGGYLERRT